MATPEYPPESEEATILAAVHSLLSAVATNNLATLLAPTFPTGGAQTLHAGHFEIQSIESLCSKIMLIPGSKAETFHDVEIKIDKTKRLAMVWADSKVWMDGVVVIEGTNALTLHKIEGRWRISSVSDVSEVVEGREGDVEKMYKGME